MTKSFRKLFTAIIIPLCAFLPTGRLRVRYSVWFWVRESHESNFNTRCIFDKHLPVIFVNLLVNTTQRTHLQTNLPLWSKMTFSSCNAITRDRQIRFSNFPTSAITLKHYHFHKHFRSFTMQRNAYNYTIPNNIS